MRSILSAVILWLTFGPAVQAQGAPCAVLSRMRQADVALQAIASRGGGGAETQAAILWLIGEEGPASGLDPGFVTDFLAAHDAALDALTRGAPVETVLAEPALRRSGERVSRYVSLFRCGNSGGVPVAGAQPLPAVDVGTGGVTPGAIPGAAWPVAGRWPGSAQKGASATSGPAASWGAEGGAGVSRRPTALARIPGVPIRSPGSIASSRYSFLSLPRRLACSTGCGASATAARGDGLACCRSRSRGGGEGSGGLHRRTQSRGRRGPA